MTKLIICDIDGVLADCSHRLPYLVGKDYEMFYSCSSMAGDKPIESGIELFNSLAENVELFDVYLLTGRPERTRKITELWLGYHRINFNRMYMRKDEDFRPSPVVKTELMQELVDRFHRYDRVCPGYFIDDDPENVKAVCKAFPNIVGITFGTRRFN